MGQEKRQTIHERLVKALAEMPSQLPQVEGYGYRYTPLPNIINAVRPILAKHGLGLYQEVESGNNEVVVRTILFDEEGNKLVSPDLVLPVIESTKTKEGKDKLNTAQCIGATITYARRYSLSAFLGIATEEDTDAHSNGRPPQGNHPQPKASKPVKVSPPPQEVVEGLKLLGFNQQAISLQWLKYVKEYGVEKGKEELMKAINRELNKKAEKED